MRTLADRPHSLKTRMAFVQNKEDELEEKRQHCKCLFPVILTDTR